MRWASWGLAACLGCVGTVESGPSSPLGGELPGTADEADEAAGMDVGSSAQPLCQGAPDVGPSVLRRLSNDEWQRTVQDLLQLDVPPSLTGLPADNVKDGFRTFAEVQPMSAQHLRAYGEQLRALLDPVLADAARRDALLGCEPSASGCLRDFVARFGRLSYRRSLSGEEIDALTSRARADALDEVDQFRFAVESLLGSPEFLYRIELGEGQGAARLRASELASRLSFALWGRGPGAELLDQAEAGALDTPDGLRSTVDAMLADPRARSFFRGFFRQWLGYDVMRGPTAPVAGWSDALIPELQQETDALLEQHAFEGTDLFAAFTSNQASLSPALSAFYGVEPGVQSFPDSHPRADAGLLGHASLLSLKGDGDMIALRGNWLRRTFFCADMHIPADVAAELGELLVGLTRVQIVERRNQEAACKGCHARIDPIGVGLARFDATGRFDESVDISEFGIEPALPDVGVRFDSLAELAQALVAAPQVGACLGEKLFVYIHGREASEQDACTLSTTRARFDQSGRDFSALIAALLEAPSFRYRRAPTGGD